MVEVIVEGESIGTLGLPFTIGRDPDCDVIVTDSSVSRRHVKVSPSDGGLFVEDIGSSNGTWIDGRRISREALGFGHPMIVGRMAVTINAVDATQPSKVQPVVKPTGQKSGEERQETLAVDIPQGYFDPSRNAPAMRMFECPGCGRRLRCAATTKRVKCRTCEAVIRFEGDTPVLERAESPVLPSVPPAAPPSPGAHPQSPVNESGKPSALSPSVTVESEGGPRRHVVPTAPVPRVSLWEFLIREKQGNFIVFAEALGILLLLIGMVASGTRATAVMLLGGIIHLSALQIGLLLWSRHGNQPSAEEQHELLDRWLSREAITAEQYRSLQRAIDQEK